METYTSEEREELYTQSNIGKDKEKIDDSQSETVTEENKDIGITATGGIMTGKPKEAVSQKRTKILAELLQEE